MDLKSLGLILGCTIFLFVISMQFGSNVFSESSLSEKGYEFKYLSEIEIEKIEHKTLYFQTIAFYNHKENIADTTRLELKFQKRDSTFWYIIPPKGFTVKNTRAREAARVYLRDN